MLPASQSPPIFDHLCLKCGYNLRGTPPTASCPECGAPPSPVTTPSPQYVQENLPRFIKLSRALRLILIATTLQLATCVLNTSLVFLGLREIADHVAAATLGIWMILLTLAACLLHNAAPGNPRAPLPILARTLLLTAALAQAAWFIAQQCLIQTSQRSHLHQTLDLLFLDFTPGWFLVPTLLTLVLLLPMLRRAALDLGARFGRGKLITLLILWFFLCVMQGLTTRPVLTAWMESTSGRIGAPTYTLGYPADFAGNYITGSLAVTAREDHCSALNPASRNDPGPAYWGEVLASSLHEALWRDQAFMSHNQPHIAAVALFYYDQHIFVGWQPANQKNPPQAPFSFVFLWPEALIASAAFILSLTLVIHLHVSTRRLRRHLNALVARSTSHPLRSLLSPASLP